MPQNRPVIPPSAKKFDRPAISATSFIKKEAEEAIRQAAGAVVRDRAGRFLLARKVRVDARQGDGAIPPSGGLSKGALGREGGEGALWRELWEETGSRAFVLEAAFAEPISFSFLPEMAARLGFAGQETRMFLLRYTGRAPLAAADSKIDTLEFAGEEEPLRRMARREGRDPFLKNRRKMGQILPSL
ncbi:NUDIX domain-containing protein [Bittarella massiliensis]|uniref:NUDIX domain-containing protein n=1 Tax=Bittarella massiliensis (ex Durand et al. 2017) TaxID=1720313 RepID=UPI00163C7D09|nr:NUDIX domain-containing protein [Bittarella massiliensis (ex Durand et al. 2017)]MBC2872187.1 NUDIX domain-containing protein [Bittarella massiliensis (ex Durand et al. 2017)]